MRSTTHAKEAASANAVSYVKMLRKTQNAFMKINAVVILNVGTSVEVFVRETVKIWMTFGGDMINCVQSCKPGCECDDGYVRESNLPSAMCVPTFICDAIRCGENEVWNYCGVKKSCVRTCEEVRKEFMLGQLDDNFKIERMNKALIGCRFNDCSADCECRTG